MTTVYLDLKFDVRFGWLDAEFLEIAECSGVEQYLERISNGVLADDRRAAMGDLQSVLAESRTAQLAFGTMGTIHLLV